MPSFFASLNGPGRSVLSPRSGKWLIATAMFGVVFGVAPAQIASADQVAEVYVLEFHVDGVLQPRTFCSEGGPVSRESALHDDSPGASTPDGALAVYLAEQKAAATDPAVPTELRALLAPTTDTEYSRSQDDSGLNEVYFDVLSAGPADLEARIIVEQVADATWKFSGSVMCMSVVVTDLDEYTRTADRLFGTPKQDSGLAL